MAGCPTVYRGLDLRLDRPVAIKVMSQEYAADPTFLTRFEREARSAARLDDPAVVAVYDQGRDGDVVFLVMELVDGGTLRDLLRERGPLSVPMALSVLEPVLRALSAAHTAGLVHRDVKPENVLISTRGEVKVADFGLVRAVTSTTMATGNVILGTVAYLSPEQVATGAADARSDVYAAGIVAYEMLTGHPPFSGDNAIAVAYQHVHADVPPVAAAAPGVRGGIAAAIDAATRRDPLARPRDAADFLARLQDTRAELGLRLAPAPLPRPARSGTPQGHPSLDGKSAVPVEPSTHRGPPGPPNPLPVPAESGVLDVPVVAAASPSAAVTRQAGPAPAPAAPPAPARAPDATAPTEHPRDRSARRRRGTTPADRPADLTAARSQVAGDPTRTDRLKRPLRGRRPNWRLRITLLVVLLLVVAAAAFGGWWLGGRWTSTPDVRGVAQDAAVALVRDAGLVPQLSSAPDNVVPSGKVSSAQPIAGTRQLRGSTVTMVISTGRPRVPQVAAGSTVDAATSAITAVGLHVSTDPKRDIYDDTVPRGSVIRTDPGAGDPVDIGSTVTLIRSLGAEPVPIPPVAGKQLDDARNALLVAGFTIGSSISQFDADDPAGTVIGTMPRVGSTAAHGSAVSLVLAVSLTVPSVSGMTQDSAFQTLTSQGFRPTLDDPAFDASVPAGDVITTVPMAGTRIDPADPQVGVIVSTAVTVPDLSSGDVGDARATLEGLGLGLTVHALFGVDSSIVSGQSPDAGTLVEPNSTVTVTAWP